MNSQSQDPSIDSAARRPRDTAGRRRFIRNILVGAPVVMTMSAGRAFGDHEEGHNPNDSMYGTSQPDNGN